MASKLIKQVSVASYDKNAPKIHSTPVETQKSSTQKVNFNQRSLIYEASKVISSLRLPTSYTVPQRQQFELSPNDVVKGNVNLQETSSANVYKFQTGLSQEEPVIIATSEFLPIYSSGNLTETGRSLSLKETSKLVTLKTSAIVLSDFNDLRLQTQMVKSEVSRKLKSETTFVRGLLEATNTTLNAFDVSSYTIPWSKMFAVEIPNFFEILKSGGYNTDKITKFSRTKLWQQSLVELKKHYSVHATGFAALNSQSLRNDENVNDSFKLSDLRPAPGYKNVWLNSFNNNIPTISDLTSPEKVYDNVSILAGYANSLYVNLETGNQSSIQPIDLSSYTFGKDIAISANAIFKEARYTEFLKRTDNRLSSRYGYTIQKGVGQENFQMWDHIIGRFPDSVLNLTVNPTGNGNSLVSFSNQAIATNNSYYNVLTLENDFINNSNTTPGTYYYIDSSLKTTDGQRFDIQRVDSVIEKTNNAIETSNLLFDLCGYDIKTKDGYNAFGVEEFYVKKAQTDVLNLSYISEKLSTVYKVYRKIIDFSLEEVQNVNTYYSKLLTPTESVGYRLAALICKSAVEPQGPYRGNTSSELKSLLFVLLSNAAIESAESRQTIGSQKNLQLKNSISEILVKSFVTNQNSSDLAAEIQAADLQTRTYPISFNSNAELNQRSVTVQSTATSSNDYLGQVVRRVFSIDINKGLWRDIVDLLKEFYNRRDLFESSSTGEYTVYSGLSKVAYMFAYFDLILRVISAQTPENLLGSYTASINFSTSSTSSPIRVSGLLVSKVSKEQLNSFYDAYAVYAGLSVVDAVKKIRIANNTLDSDSETLLRKTEVFKNFLVTLGKTLTSFKDFLQRNFSTHIENLNQLFSADSSLSSTQRINLLNSTFSYEQLKLFNYLSSEIQERIDSSYRSVFSTVLPNENAPDIFPVDELDLYSFRQLLPAFNEIEFYPAKGINKKIVTFGLPPKILRALYSTARTSLSTERAMRQGIIRVKVYKLDKIYPQVVYKPKTYLFDVNRFPTRNVSNWDFTQTDKQQSYLLKVPTKVVTPTGEIIQSKSFSDDFRAQVYGSFLTQQDKLEIYRNHSMSFLLQEYMKWFSDVKFDDSRYTNYTGINRDVRLVTDQYPYFVEVVKASSKTSSTPITTSDKNSVIAIVKDPTQNNLPYYTPITTTSSTNTSSRTNNTKVSSYTVDVTNTLKTYFRSETFVQVSGISILSRVFYPKKFDRVFSIIVDSDDFYVDTDMSEGQYVQRMVDAGALVRINSSTSDQTIYKHRDTTENDVSFDEFFITVEPYDYVERRG